MVKKDVTEEKTLRQIGSRLQSAAIKAGYLNATALADAIRKMDLTISDSTVRKHWGGREMPNGSSLLAYYKILNVSIHWLLTGNESDPPKDWPDLINDLEKIASRHGLTLQRSDEHTATILRLLRTESFRTLDPEKKKIIADLIQQFVIERKESMG